MMKWYQTQPNVVGFNEEITEKQRLMFTLQMTLLSIIWPSSWLHIPPKPPWWLRISTAGDCVSDPSVEGQQEEGVAPKDLLGSPQSSETKGTLWPWLIHPRKHYFLSHQIQHPPHMSCSLPRTESPFLTSSAAQHSQQQSVLTRCRHWHSNTVHCAGLCIH